MQKEESALCFRIRSMIPELSKSEAAVAEYIAGNPDEVINLSVSALADCCGVSEPTVVRACRNLGFSGYQALKIALIQSISTTVQFAGEEVTAEDSMSSVVQKVFGAASDAVSLTKSSADPAVLERAAEVLLKAKRIYIFGVGGSAAVASDIQHKFLRLGLDAHALFAVSHSGSSKVVVDNTQLAKNNGATVISLSSMGKSPLTELADISLYTAANETRYRIVAISSRIAELTIVDTLYSYMSFRTGKPDNMIIEKAIEDQMY